MIHGNVCDVLRLTVLAGLLLLPVLLVRIARSPKPRRSWSSIAVLMLIALATMGFARVHWLIYLAANPPACQVFEVK